MGSVDELMTVEVVMATQDQVDQVRRRFLCELDVAGFTGVGKGDDDVCALLAK